MKYDLVSVVVPSYNYEKYITECLESIEKQDYKDIELIIVDDCSKDNSKVLIKQFINKCRSNNRFVDIKYSEHIENRGAHYTINEGIEQAQGKYIAVINADDLYENNRFSKIIAKMQNKNAQIAFSSIEVIDSNSEMAEGEEADRFRVIQKGISADDKVSYALMHQNVSISTGNLVFTKELYKKLDGFKEYKYIHDWDFILRASLLEEPLYVTDTKYYYRLHNENSFRELGDIADQEVALVLNNFFNEIKNSNAINKDLSSNRVKENITNTYLFRYWDNSNILNMFIKRVINKVKNLY